MKKNLAYGLLLSSSVLVSGCQGVESLFTDSPNRSVNNNNTYGNSHHATTVYQSGAPTQNRSSAPNSNSATNAAANSSANASAAAATPGTSTQAAKKTVGTAVPTEAPTVGQ